MTPRIRMIVARFFNEDATSWHFIDIGELPEHTERRAVDAELILHPPYPRTVFVGTDYAGALFATRIEAGTDHIVVGGVGVSKWNRVTYLDPVAFIRNPDGPGLRAVSALDDKQLDDKTLSRQLRWTHALFDKLPAVREAFAAAARKSFINAKRAARGEPPSLYDWTTVLIQPPAPKSEPQGGTHASPRMHDRRGHWRTVRGQRYWVRDCKVGDPSRGARFKDYRIAA